MAETVKRSILIVDDSRMNLMILEDVLKEYDLSMAMNGEDALETATEDPPDLILLDIVLPGMDGFAVLEKLKAQPVTADIPVIFLSGRNGQEDLSKGRDLGCVDFICKPFQADDVLQRVLTTLTSCSLR